MTDRKPPSAEERVLDLLGRHAALAYYADTLRVEIRDAAPSEDVTEVLEQTARDHLPSGPIVNAPHVKTTSDKGAPDASPEPEREGGGS